MYFEESPDNPYLIGFKQIPETISVDDQARLKNEAQKAYENSVLPALLDLYSYMVHKYIPNHRKEIAFSDLPNGKEWYEFKVRTHTTTDLTPKKFMPLAF